MVKTFTKGLILMLPKATKRAAFSKTGFACFTPLHKRASKKGKKKSSLKKKFFKKGQKNLVFLAFFISFFFLSFFLQILK
jgi:hypothetical protein